MKSLTESIFDRLENAAFDKFKQEYLKLFPESDIQSTPKGTQYDAIVNGDTAVEIKYRNGLFSKKLYSKHHRHPGMIYLNAEKYNHLLDLKGFKEVKLAYMLEDGMYYEDVHDLPVDRIENLFVQNPGKGPRREDTALIDTSKMKFIKY